MLRVLAILFASLALIVQVGIGAFPGGDLCFCMRSCESVPAPAAPAPKHSCCCKDEDDHPAVDLNSCPCHKDCPTCLRVLAPDKQAVPVVRVSTGHDDSGFALDLPPIELASFLMPVLPIAHQSPRANESPPQPHLCVVRSVRLNV